LVDQTLESVPRCRLDWWSRRYGGELNDDTLMARERFVHCPKKVRERRVACSCGGNLAQDGSDSLEVVGPQLHRLE